MTSRRPLPHSTRRRFSSRREWRRPSFSTGEATPSSRRGCLRARRVHSSWRRQAVGVVKDRQRGRRGDAWSRRLLWRGVSGGPAVAQGSASAITPTTILIVAKAKMVGLRHKQRAMSDRFIAHMLARNIRIEEDLAVLVESTSIAILFRHAGSVPEDDGLPLCRFAHVHHCDAAMLDILDSDREGNSHGRRLDSSGARCVWGDRESDRMVPRARPAIRSRIRQPSLACRTTFLSRRPSRDNH